MNDWLRLWNYYAAGRVHLPRPRYLCFNCTLRCDGRCGHCGIWRQKAIPEIGAAALERILSSGLFGKIETAWLTGGEPTLRDDIPEISAAVARALPSLKTHGIATNALDPDRVLDRVGGMRAALAGSGAGVFVHVSLDGVGEVHDRLRGRDGAFEAVKETLSGLAELKRSAPDPFMEVGLNCVIQPGNVGGLDDLHSFAEKMSLPLTFNVALVTDQVYRNRDREDDLALSERDKARGAEFLARVAPNSPPAFRYQHRIIREVLAGRRRPRRCLTLYSTVNINADGTLIPCPASSDIFPRNVAVLDPEQVWKSKEAAAMRKEVERRLCPGCMLSCSLGDSMPLSEWLAGGWD